VIKKQYYRLSELQKLKGISEEDISYYMENDTVRFSTLVNKQELMVGKWEGQHIIGFCTFTYTGLLYVPKPKVREIAFNSKVSLDTLLLPKGNLPKNVSIDYPFDLCAPNNLIAKWHGAVNENIHHIELPVIMLPTEAIGLMHSYLNVLSLMSKSDVANAHPERVLNRRFINISKNDLVLNEQELSKFNDDSNAEEKAVNPIADITFKNDLYRLVAHAYITMAKPSAKQIFIELEKDSMREEDSRKFDTHNILIDAVDDKLVWKDKLSRLEEKSVSLRRLENILTEVKKTIKAENTQ
jgi:hypothetical protein